MLTMTTRVIEGRGMAVGVPVGAAVGEGATAGEGDAWMTKDAAVGGGAGGRGTQPASSGATITNL